MLKTLALCCLAWFAILTPAWATTEDNACVQQVLIDTHFLSGKADGKLGGKSVKAGAAFLERTGLGEKLPALSKETAPEWCTFLSSDDGKAIAELASFTLYDVAIKDLPTVDDGTGPLPFDFAPYKLSDKFDGMDCTFSMRATFSNGSGHIMASGRLTFADGGHARFTESHWETGGLSSPETLKRANIAITSKTALVGKMPVFHLFQQEGGILPEAAVVTLDPKRSKLSGEPPQGEVEFDIDSGAKGEMSLRCAGAKIAFDFSPYDLSPDFDGYSCDAKIISIFDGGKDEVQTGSSVVSVGKDGKLILLLGKWETGGPSSSFKDANLAITKSRALVGAMDLYLLFPDPNAHPPFTVKLNGSEGSFGDDLEGRVELELNPGTSAAMELSSCRPPKR